MCDSKKHQTHTFRVFEGIESGFQHCVSNLVKEHSASLWIERKKKNEPKMQKIKSQLKNLKLDHIDA